MTTVFFSSSKALLLLLMLHTATDLFLTGEADKGRRGEGWGLQWGHAQKAELGNSSTGRPQGLVPG